MDNNDNELCEKLMEFGFAREYAIRILKVSGAKTIDEVLDFIEEAENNEENSFKDLNKENNLNKENGSNEINLNKENNSNEINLNEENNPNEINLNKENKNINEINNEKVTNEVENKIKLTPEEAQQKAIELQRKIREKKLKKEKEEELERERKRLLSAKEMQKTRELLEELDKKNYVQSLKREREEHEKERERQLELIKREYKARFGVEYNFHQKKKNIEDLTENERREEIAITFNKLKNEHKDKKKELIASLNILKTYFSNIKNNILEKKFQKIKKENKVFSEKIKIYEDMIHIMKLVGFVESDEIYTIQNYPNTYLLSNAIKYIDFIIKTLD